MDTIFAIMTEEKGNQKETLKINTSKLKKYFPKNTTPKQMEETIIKLLSVNCRGNGAGTAANLLFSGGKCRKLRYEE